MKNSIKVLFCLLLCIVLTGCNNSSDVNKTSKEEVKVVEKTDEEKLQEFVVDMRDNVKEVSNDTLTADIEARGKSIVYVYTYTTTYSKSQVSTMKPAIEKSIKESEKTFTDLLDVLRKEIPSTESVILEYINGDGTLVTSIEIK